MLILDEIGRTDDEPWAYHNDELNFCFRFLCLGSKGRKSGCRFWMKLVETDDEP